jgi:hypothetical protein
VVGLEPDQGAGIFVIIVKNNGLVGGAEMLFVKKIDEHGLVIEGNKLRFVEFTETLGLQILTLLLLDVQIRQNALTPPGIPK